MQPESHSTPPKPACPDEPTPPDPWAVLPGIQRSLDAFRRDLPELMKTHYGLCVAYHGDQRVGFARTQTELYEECLRRGIKRGEFIVEGIVPEIEYDDDEEA